MQSCERVKINIWLHKKFETKVKRDAEAKAHALLQAFLLTKIYGTCNIFFLFSPVYKKGSFPLGTMTVVLCTHMH